MKKQPKSMMILSVIAAFMATALFLPGLIGAGIAAQGFIQGGLWNFDADLTVPSLNDGNPFPAVVNPDNDFLPPAVENGVAYAPIESPPVFTFGDYPVFAVIQCDGFPPGTVLPGVGDPKWATPWDRANDPPYSLGTEGPLFCLLQVGVIEGVYLDAGDAGTGVPYEASGQFRDLVHDIHYDIGGGVQVFSPGGMPYYAFYGTGSMALTLGRATGSMVDNDNGWAGGWPGIVLDKIFFSDLTIIEPATDFDVEFKKFQDRDVVQPSTPQVYSIEVSLPNPGFGPDCGVVTLENFRIVDNLPDNAAPGTERVCEVLTGGLTVDGTYDLPTNRVTFDFGNLDVDTCSFDPGQPVIVCNLDVEVRETATVQLCNQASTLLDNPEDTRVNNIDTVCANILSDTAPGEADVFVGKSGPRSVRPNTTFQYYVNGGNAVGAGGATATNVQIIDQLAPEFVYEWAPLGVYDAQAHTVTWNLPDLGSGDLFTVWVRGHVDDGTGSPIINTASISANEDANDVNNHFELVIEVGEPRDPNIKIACAPGTDLEDPASVDACTAEENLAGRLIVLDDPVSRRLDFMIRAENVSGFPAEDVFIEDVLNPNIDDSTLMVFDGGTYNPATRTLRWEVGTLSACLDPVPEGVIAPCPESPADDSHKTQVRFSASVTPDLACGDDVHNQAVITFPTGADPVTSTNVTTHFTRPRADLDADCDIDSDDYLIFDAALGACVSDYNYLPEANVDGDDCVTECDRDLLFKIDSDGDGTVDCVDTDDDNDGVPDAGDAFPFDPLESVDTDGDGVGNNADTDDDNDGLSDGDEVNLHGTDPLNSDTDGDGLTDGQEVAAGSDPKVWSVFFVDGGVLSSGDGKSWGTAFKTVQPALDACAAAGGGEVWVKAGTYNESITLKDRVALYGGFTGTESLRNHRDWENNVTTIDGQNSVLHVVTGAANVTIDGFVITSGNAVGTSDYSDPDSQGGGVYNQADYLTVRNCAFSGNNASVGMQIKYF